MKLEYRDEIDGLRAVAVLSVLFGHAGFYGFSGGFVGVDIFFVISGFLITHNILHEISNDKFRFLSFYERRIRRILPLLLFVIVAIIPFTFLFMTPEQFEENAESIPWVLGAISNYFFLFKIGYFQLAAETKATIHTWSLAIEEQYYLVAPFIVLILYNFSKKFLIWLFFIIAIAGVSYSSYYANINPEANYYLIQSRSWELAIGTTGALLCHFHHDIVFKDRMLKFGGYISFLGLFLISLSIVFINKSTLFPSFVALPVTVGTLLILLYARKTNFIGKMLSNKILVGIGLISYSLYLWHQPLYAFARIRLPYEPTYITYFCLIAAAITLSLLTYLLIEKPFRNKKLIPFKVVACFLLTMAVISITYSFAVQQKYLEPHYTLKAKKQNAERLLAKRMHDSHPHRPQCQYNPRIKISTYIKKWRCSPTDPKTIYDKKNTKLSVLLFGDSTADDIARGFTLNGYSVYQISGNVCPLISSPTQARWRTRGCDQLRKLAHKIIKDNDIKHIILANMHRETNLSLADSAKYWSSRYDSVIVLGPRPFFQKFAIRLSNSARFGNYPEPTVDVSHQIRENSQEQKIITERGNVFIDETELFCAINKCKFRNKDGKLLMIDFVHYSLTGAQEVVKNLIAKLCNKGPEIQGLKCRKE